MPGQLGASVEGFLAVVANERLVLAVQHLVPLQALLVLEALVADVALERLILFVHRVLVLLELLRGEEFAITVLASVTSFISMHLLVTLQQVQARELLLANRARERLFLRMRAHMLVKVILAEEMPIALGALVVAIAMCALNVQHQSLTQGECALALITSVHSDLSGLQFSLFLDAVCFLLLTLATSVLLLLVKIVAVTRLILLFILSVSIPFPFSFSRLASLSGISLIIVIGTWFFGAIMLQSGFGGSLVAGLYWRIVGNGWERSGQDPRQRIVS